MHAFAVIAVIGFQVGHRAPPRLVVVKRRRRHEDAQVIVVIGHVLGGVNPPVLLSLLRITTLDVVEGVEFHRERLLQAVGAHVGRAVVIRRVHLRGFSVSQTVARAPDETATVGQGPARTAQLVPCAGNRLRIGRVVERARPARVAVHAVHRFLTIVVRDDERKAVGAVANLIRAAALRGVGDLELKVRLETIPDVYFAVPPHGADALRGAEIGARLPRRSEGGVTVRSRERFGQSHDVLWRRIVIFHHRRIARKTQVVLNAVVDPRLVPTPRRAHTRSAGVVDEGIVAREVWKVKLHVKSRAVFARTDGLRVAVIAHDANRELIAIRRSVVVDVVSERSSVRKR